MKNYTKCRKVKLTTSSEKSIKVRTDVRERRGSKSLRK